jgi:hypothetical protein
MLMQGSMVPRRQYLELEAACDALFTFHPELVPQLLQTDDYAHAAVALDGASPDQVQRRLAIRTERKLAAFGRPGRRITVVLGASALSVGVASAEVMAHQYRHLCDMSSGQDVDVRVVPWSARLQPAICGGFTLMDFEDAADPPVVHVESHTGGRFEPDREVAKYRTLMAALVQHSVPVPDFQPGQARSRTSKSV